MIVYDPIYGAFELPANLTDLVQTPEVRRLSQIRLLNTITPSLATLGEIRRFSHTLGVLCLVLKNRLVKTNQTIRSALSAAVLLHDIGTPPFAHLLEYHLKERTGWTHENVIKAILHSQHVPEGRANQFFAKSVVRFRKELTRSNIDVELVEAIVAGEHELSPLLFGTLDFDNLDNVARMAWALGQLENSSFIKSIAEQLSVIEGKVALPRSALSEVEKWATTRRNCYDVIVFDPPTVAAQAVLSLALEQLLEGEHITEFDWVLTDEQLLEVLLKCPATKALISNKYLGRLPQNVYTLQIAESSHTVNPSARSVLRSAIESSLSEVFGSPGLGYVFVDKGTFGKQLTFVDPIGLKPWSVGTGSRSTVLYGFLLRSAKVSAQDCMKALESLLKQLVVPAESILRAEIGVGRKILDAQESLNLAAS